MIKSSSKKTKTPILELRNVVKTYTLGGVKFNALDGVCWEILRICRHHWCFRLRKSPSCILLVSWYPASGEFFLAAKIATLAKINWPKLKSDSGLFSNNLICSQTPASKTLLTPTLLIFPILLLQNQLKCPKSRINTKFKKLLLNFPADNKESLSPALWSSTQDHSCR